MFDNYDDTDKSYRITYSDGKTRDVTEQGLYEFYIFSTTGITKSFSELLNDLRNGHLIVAEDNDFDWNMGSNVYKGKLYIEPIGGIKPQLTQSVDMFKREYGCSHPRKYVNSAGGVKFYVCPDCLADLGNA